MKRRIVTVVAVLGIAAGVCAQDIKVTGIQAKHRNGQTFVTWKDAAEGEDSAGSRYSLYRSDSPITQENMAQAEACVTNLLYHSGKLFGSAFNKKDRLDPNKPMAKIEEGGQPLPLWSGLAVVTVKKDGKSYYAVVATGDTNRVTSAVVPGESATKEPVEEKVGEIQPILLEDSKSRKGPYIQQTCIKGTKGLPLMVGLHASSGGGGGAAEYGDYYLYFSRPEWGYQAGMPGVFSVQERQDGGHRLALDSRDAIVTPGAGPMETFWFGYVCVPPWADHKEPRAYNFTELRMLWVVNWVIRKYEADPNRVYAGGGSMGAWGSSTFAFRHPELFAAVYPNRPRTRQRGMPSLVKVAKPDTVMMDDGKTTYFDRMDMVKFATEHHEDLPFYAWCCGRHDGFASFKEQIDLVKALTASHHGFAFAWNDGDHSSGSAPMGKVTKYYGSEKFALNKSYPAFGNSSINDDIGSGEVEEMVDGKPKRVIKDGVLEGGINLGFVWKDVADEEAKWAVTFSNGLAKAEMTVDVTPRRCQKFKAKAGDKFKWANTAGGSGDVAADQWGLVTVEKVKILPGADTTLVITK
jgi:hypothetical protein